MKNLIIVGMLAAVLLTPSFSFAQTLTQEEVNQQLLSLINDLMKQVLVLMAKLQEVQATQATQTQTLGAIQTQTAPIITAPAQPISPSISFGEPHCVNESSVVVPFTVNGSGWEYGNIKVRNLNLDGSEKSHGGTNFTSSNTREVWVGDDNGTTILTTVIGNRNDGGSYHNEVVPLYTFTNTINVGDVCQ